MIFFRFHLIFGVEPPEHHFDVGAGEVFAVALDLVKAVCPVFVHDRNVFEDVFERFTLQPIET